MKFNIRNNFFNNKLLLYIVLFLSITNIFSYLIQQKYQAILFFLIITYFTSLFSSDYKIMLLSAIISTNLLLSFTNVLDINYNILKNKEGFESKDSNSCSADTETSCNDLKGCEWSNNKCASSVLSTSTIENSNSNILSKNNNSNKESNTSNNETNANNNQTKENNDEEIKKQMMESVMGNTSINSISDKTNELLLQQNNLVSQLGDMGPVLKEALGALSSLGNGNYLEMFNSLSGKVDDLYKKYPSSFPSDYKEKSDEMKVSLKNMSGLTNDLNNLNNKIK